MSRKVIQWTVDYWWSQFCLTHFHSNSCKFWRDQKWLQWSLANLAIFFHKFLTGSSCCALLGPCLLPRKLMTCENMFECTMMSCKSATCTSQLPSANVMAIDSHPPPTSLIGQVNLFQLSNQLSLKTPRAIAASSHASAHGKATRSLRIRPASSGRGSYPAQTVPERLRETALSLSLPLSLSLSISCALTHCNAPKSDINRKISQCGWNNNKRPQFDGLYNPFMVKLGQFIIVWPH